MNVSPVTQEVPDPAAVFAIAHSLWATAIESPANENLSEWFNGRDQFMREVMRVAEVFEEWACKHIKFSDLTDVWPYFLQDRFGPQFVNLWDIGQLPDFNEEDCLRIALRLSMPVFLNDNPRIPFFIQKENPVSGSRIKAFQIKTVRDSIYDGNVETYSLGADPFDDDFGNPYVGIYAVIGDVLEHIADRENFSSSFQLAKDLFPSVDLPDPMSYACRGI